MDIKKTVILGTFGAEKSSRVGRYNSALHVRVEILWGRDDLNPDKVKPRLSICGDTYRPGARDIESSGQIRGDVRALLADPDAKLNRTREQITRLLEIWERWHLNDMRPGCEHQRASWNPLEKITLVKYRLRTDISVRARNVQRDALARLQRGEAVTLAPDELRLLNLEYWVTLGADQPAPGPDYEVESRETKTAGWVTFEEHPRGLLSKPCPECGYKYGRSWLYEEVPADVVKFLEDF